MKHFLKYLLLTLAVSLAMYSCDTPEKRYERARTLYEEGTELRSQRLSEEATERFLQALALMQGCEPTTENLLTSVFSVYFCNVRRGTGAHYPYTHYRHGGGTSAISQARRRIPIAWEIAGQARNDG